MQLPITKQDASGSPTFCKDASIELSEEIGAASISPAGRDVVLANNNGLLIIDLDNPYSSPRRIVNKSHWDVADVQWSPFADRSNWVASTCNQKAVIYNLAMAPETSRAPIQFTLHSHGRAITDINFSAHNPDVLATCAVDSFVMTWDLRAPEKQANSFEISNHLDRIRSKFQEAKELPWGSLIGTNERIRHVDAQRTFNPTLQHKPFAQMGDFVAGASQVKWNRQNEYVLASSHHKHLYTWDVRHGAKPLTTIPAHTTKICGIDWHRSEPNKILTCSLDKSIKIWEGVGTQADITQPYRVIRTLHPVRRARHTPFPNGILTMSERGTSALDLYTHDAGGSAQDSGIAKSAHAFQAHAEDCEVKEFLWRSRGSIENGIDEREFQLVTFGTDNHLNLYTISSDLLEKTVGFKRGGPITEKPSTTRRGAMYLTYRDGPPKQDVPRVSTSSNQRQGVLSTLIENADRLDVINANGWRTSVNRETMSATSLRQNRLGNVTNEMKWIHGVKVGERHQELGAEVDASILSKNQIAVQPQKDLKAEVSQAGKRFTTVKFEHTDFQNHQITVGFNGPWGDPDNAVGRKSDRKLVFLRLTIDFPPEYPSVTEEGSHPLQVRFQKTTAATDEVTLTRLRNDLQDIAFRYADKGLEALEPVLSYALGERSQEELLALIKDEEKAFDWPESGSSSSEDDAFEGIDQNDMTSSQTNTNVPLPIQCTARFFGSGYLVLSRAPTIPTTSGLDPIRLNRNPQNFPKDEIFESFGRLDPAHGYRSESPVSSSGSWDLASSQSSASSSGDETGLPVSRFQPPLAWQRGNVRFQAQQSHPSSSGAAKPSKPNFILTILDSSIENLMPSRRDLAEEYQIFGDGPSVCLHNSEVARKYGLDDLADVWLLCKLILNNEVPLEILNQNRRREQVLVLARRALVRIKRKDSGMDLQFDEADPVTNPKLKGRIKWGHHTVVTWLIPALFDHFERLADTQMLAMLSCIFSEPAAREGVTSAMSKMRQSCLPMSMEAPAFSLDYFASADAAWSLFKASLSLPSTPAYSRYANVHEFGWHRLTKTLDTYGSHSSSNGLWGSDTIPSEPVTPYSTGSTPPNPSRPPTLRSHNSNTPYSTSPEHHVSKRSSTANFASAIATLSRPFSNALSSSPPVKATARPDADLSTSAPTSGVTWGTTTFYGSGSGNNSTEKTPMPVTRTTKHGKRASFGQSDHVNINYYSDSDSDFEDFSYPQGDATSDYTAPPTPGAEDDSDGTTKITVTLKNQDRFDEEASVSAPLLDMGKEWLFRAWRNQYAEMLGCWGLVSARAEVLKFNGLVSYFPPGIEREGGGSKAGSVHLGFKGDENPSTPLPLPPTTTTTSLSTPISRSSTLAPPPSPFHNPRSPIEFQPSTPVNTATHTHTLNTTTIDSTFDPTTTPSVSITPATHPLGLSIPSPPPLHTNYPSITESGYTTPINTQPKPFPTSSMSTSIYTGMITSRPSIGSRTHSTLSKASSLGGTTATPNSTMTTGTPNANTSTTIQPSRHISTPSYSSAYPSSTATPNISGAPSPSHISHSASAAAAKRDAGKETVHACSICWIRVQGRFFLCPRCGHVAHFGCLDTGGEGEGDGHRVEEDECVVGCGCGCGFESQSEEEIWDGEDEKAGLRFKDGGAREGEVVWNEKGDFRGEDERERERVGEARAYDGIADWKKEGGGRRKGRKMG
ncbi:hypothetical protein B0J11DRAFT_537697 [Dendryphion nanum]|uniref:WDR59/RTC1-like RING zinc finger domain-containing protein n=1 Tax=Dendryphion nanum TaxID=256645 RepID=A0A9P9DAK8_9PLEO|nr:hypothetical protein B0J11DRAFT_537697 [Dendryphion nanum]